ncbi:MAG: ABC transporter substrate-binding protein [Bacteroidales bacterium]|nr:ABC transporter substrate-binding protein [Bacteroidales bacterium]
MKQYRHLTIPLLFMLVLLCTACSQKGRNDDKMIFHYNESGGIQTLDPAYSSGQAVIWATNQLFNGLVELDDSMHIVPSIAKNWEISEDGCTYTFNLRNDVCFHNTDFYPFETKRYVKASDFVYSFGRILDGDVASPGAWVFQKVKRNADGTPCFEALNDTTFQITLSEAFPPFLGILTMKYCSVVPKEVVEHYGKDFRNHPVGTGPFKFQLWQEGVKMVLRKNPDYFEKDEKGQQLPYLDAIAISFIVDKQSVFMEFMKGSIDFMSGVEACYKDALLTKEGELNPEYKDEITLITGPYLNTEYLGFMLKDNGKDNPLLNKKIRQAINYGFDREKMMKFLRNNVGYAGTSGFIPMGMESFNPERVKGYDYNPKKAAELLAEAGYPHGKGLPSISVAVSANYADLCQYIQHELSEIGIDLKLDVTQGAQQREMMRNYQLPFFRGSWICDYPDAENYLALFYSKNLQPVGSNYTHYVNKNFDKIYEASQRCTDQDERNEYYTRMDSMLMEDAPVVVLYYDKVVRFTRKEVTGMGINPINLLDLRRVKISRKED